MSVLLSSLYASCWKKPLKLKLSFTTTPGWPIPYFSTDLINELEIPAAVSPFLSKLGPRAAVNSLQWDMPLIPPGITTCAANLSFKYSKNLTYSLEDVRFEIQSCYPFYYRISKSSEYLSKSIRPEMHELAFSEQLRKANHFITAWVSVLGTHM